jgi:hypothetical protein
MKKQLVLMMIFWGMFSLLLNGCSQNSKPTLVESNLPMRSLCDQQEAAYPVIADNSYLVIADFEDAAQLNDADLYLIGDSQVGKSRIFHSGSPTATGEGAMGVFFDTLAEYRLSYTLPIQKWTGYNMLLASIYIEDPKTECVLEIFDLGGKSYKKHLMLGNGWNKIKIDLEPLANVIDIGNVATIHFDFKELGNTHLYLDDMILVDYHKLITGEEGGTAGSLYAVQDGKRIRVGANKRFELVFSSGRWIGWYDLTTDENRQNNLLPASSQGIEVFQGPKRLAASLPADSEVTVHTSLLASNRYELRYRVEYYYDEYAMKLGPDLILTYRMRPDGEILFEATVRNASEQMEIGFHLAGGQGFEPVIGRIRPEDGGGPVEYGLLRRTGKKAGEDFLMAVKPWKSPMLPVKCRRDTSRAGTTGLLFTSETSEGKNTIQGMIRIWPADIDNLANAEKYVREYFTTK